MKVGKCVYPRRAYNLMKAFLNTASDMYYPTPEWDYEKTEILLHKSDCFAADTSDFIGDDAEQVVFYNFDELFDETAIFFRDFWCERAPMLKEFEDITISLLHELGHLETNDEIRKDFPMWLRELAELGLDSKYDSDKEKNYAYFTLPDEKAATEWAIDWLANNAAIAKEFEKEFLKCWEVAA